MDNDAITESLRQTLDRDSKRDVPFGEYHPSTITGCPLKAFLDKMVESETVLNSWLFQGSAVHHYMETTGLMQEALHNAGYHALDTEFEVSNQYKVEDGVKIVGTCDVLCEGPDGRTIFDLKYTSLKPEYGHGRMMKYLSQANTYAHMFDADEYGLIIINSKSQTLLDDIDVMDGKMSEDNWAIVQAKAVDIHNTLEKFGYPEGERWHSPDLKDQSREFWSEVMDDVEREQCPSYDKECNYCDHSDYCPVKNGEAGGIQSTVK